jgi:hypothetical protein
MLEILHELSSKRQYSTTDYGIKGLEDLAHQKDTDIMSTLSLFALKQIN